MSNPREVLHYSQIYYTQWKKNELPYKVLLSWLERELQTLKDRLIELGEEIEPSGLPKLGLLIRRDECKNAIPYLQAIIDEVKESVPSPVSPSSQAPETGDISIITPEQVLQYEEQALGLLLQMPKIKYRPEIKTTAKDGEKTIPAEYWIKTSFEDVRSTLFDLKEKGEIHIIDIDLFMKSRLKGKKGGNIANSFRTSKSVKKRKTS